MRKVIGGSQQASLFSIALALYSAGVGCAPAFAQAPQDDPNANPAESRQADASTEKAGIAEIVVTAQRREQNLQNVPVAVNAFSSEMVETRRISDIQSL